MAGYRSLAQEQYFHRQMESGKMKPGTVQKFNNESEGNPVNVPNRVPMKKPVGPPMPGQPPHPDMLGAPPMPHLPHPPEMPTPPPHPLAPPMGPPPPPGAAPHPGIPPHGVVGVGVPGGMPGVAPPKTTQDLRDLFKQKFGTKKPPQV